MTPTIRGFCTFALPCLVGCHAPWDPLVGCQEYDACGSTTSGTSVESPTSVGEIHTVTGDADTSGGASSGGTDVVDESAEGADSSTSDTFDPPPSIGPHAVTPDYTDVNALLAITATAHHAEGVRLQIDDGDPVELVQVAPGEFAGEITAFTGMHNGKHVAHLVAWRGELESEAAEVDYVIALPPPGYERHWSVGGQEGFVAAVDVLPDGRPVEFMTLFENGEPRCYLQLRELDGTPVEPLPVLPSAYCRATDLTIDRETGMMHVLLDRKGGNGTVWWVGQIAAWGLGPVNIGTGTVGDTALALARHPDMIAVCGSQTNDEPDGRDAFAVLLRPGEAAEPRLFDYWPVGNPQSHRFVENARDCKFSGDTLVLVGEAWGRHDNFELIKRDRLAVLEYDVMVGGDGKWTVAGPGPGVQSRALALDIDDEGRSYIAGYTCGDDCKPDGEVRVYEPGGVLTAQVQLGALGSLWLGPHDIAWSPAGYAVVALGAQVGQEFVFQVQAIDADKFRAAVDVHPEGHTGTAARARRDDGAVGRGLCRWFRRGQPPRVRRHRRIAAPYQPGGGTNSAHATSTRLAASANAGPSQGRRVTPGDGTGTSSSARTACRNSWHPGYADVEHDDRPLVAVLGVEHGLGPLGRRPLRVIADVGDERHHQQRVVAEEVLVAAAVIVDRLLHGGRERLAEELPSRSCRPWRCK
jgi:hypothetical protein